MVLYGILFSRTPVSKVDVVLHAEKCHVEKKILMIATFWTACKKVFDSAD